MTDHRKKTTGNSYTEKSRTPGFDRRDFFRSAAALAVSGVSATTSFSQSGPAASAPATDANRELQQQTRRALRWSGPPFGNWVRTRSGVDHNVVIVGAGHSGVAIGYGLRRKGVGPVQIIDQAEPGRAGIWRNIARMHQLRTPKMIPGPESGNPDLSFRAWFETLNGPEAFDALDRIPRLAWADYLTWFQSATNTQVRYGTRLLEIEPQGDVLRLHLETAGTRRIETTRKLVLANGYAGAGGASVPEFLRVLPSHVWTHTTGVIPVETLKGKTVAVIGAGSNAFDAAAVVLEGGAAEVHLFDRRSYVDYQAPTAGPQPAPAFVDRGYPNLTELGYELPDGVRWRNFLLGDRRPATVPFDSMQRALAFKNFHIHLNTSLADVAFAGKKVSAKAGRRTLRFDYLIAATGYRIDLAAQPELKRIHESIALWRDRFRPASGEENAAGGAHPYLGSGFEFLPRAGQGGEFLRNIHCFNLAAQLSFGIPVGDILSMVYHPRLVAAVARDLYLESVDTAVHERYINTPLTPPDPAPYLKAVEGEKKAVA
jgi:cation diffusion facilitator CzcD-associated flavoprotein CzcO